MKEFIKFTMSKGDDITLPKELAERLIDNDGQMLKIPNENGSWSGKTINKAHIVSTSHDTHMELNESNKERYKNQRLDRPKSTPEQIKKVEDIKKKIKDKFKIK
jgi:hypothetical protein